MAWPFRFQDTIFGFKYSLDSVSVAPESLFVHKAIDTPQDGKLTLDGDYAIAPNRLGVAARWVSGKLGLTVGADLDSVSYVNHVDVSKSLSVDKKHITLSGAYDVRKQAALAGVDVRVEATNIALAYDTADKDAVLSVSHELDADNIVTPSVSSKATVGLAFLHKWRGGALRAKYHYPADKLHLEWRDEGASGAWVTKAEVPIRNAKLTKVTLTRDWTV